MKPLSNKPVTHIRQYEKQTCFGCAAAMAVGDIDTSLIHNYLRRDDTAQRYTHREIGAYLLFRGLMIGASATNPLYEVFAVEDREEAKFISAPVSLARHESFCFAEAAKSRGRLPQEAFDELISHYIETSGINPDNVADVDAGGVPGGMLAKKSIVLGYVTTKIPMWLPAILVVASKITASHAVYWDGGGNVFDSAKEDVGKLEDYKIKYWYPLTRIADDPLESDPLYPYVK